MDKSIVGKKQVVYHVKKNLRLNKSSSETHSDEQNSLYDKNLK
jgi:hypothetical protein